MLSKDFLVIAKSQSSEAPERRWVFPWEDIKAGFKTCSNLNH